MYACMNFQHERVHDANAFDHYLYRGQVPGWRWNVAQPLPLCVGECVPQGTAICPMTSNACSWGASSAQCSFTEQLANASCGQERNQNGSTSCEYYEQNPKGANVVELQSTTAKLNRWWAVLGSPVCCEYEGKGKPCSSGTACTTEPSQQRELDRFSHAYMGEGARMRRPQPMPSSRPSLSGVGFEAKKNDFDRWLTQKSATPYIPASGWVQVCIDGLVHSTVCPALPANPKQPGVNWPKSRFGASVLTLGSSVRVAVFGGFACADTNCSTYTAFNDMWELDLNLVQSVTDALLVLRELSPVASGLGGAVAVSLDGSDQRLHVLGGCAIPFANNLLGQIYQRGVPYAAESREIFVFELKMKSLMSTYIPAVSGQSAVNNQSMAIMFGGFVGNTMTNGLLT